MPRRLAVLLVAFPLAAAHASPFAYVANTGSDPGAVTVIDLDGDIVETSLIQSESYPRHVATTRDGAWLFATTSKGSFERYAVNETLHVWNAWVDLGLGNQPTAMAVSPDGQRVYVAMENDDSFAVVENVTADSANVLPYARYSIGAYGGLYIGVDEWEEWLYIAHLDGSVTIVDLTTLDPVARTVSSTNRAGVVSAPGGASMLGPWFIVADSGGHRLRSMLSPTASLYYDHLLPEPPGGVFAYMDGQSARYTTVFAGTNEVHSIPLGTRGTGGIGPADVAWSEAQRVDVVTNFASDDVSIMRASPVLVRDASVASPTDVAVGPVLPPSPEPRRSSLRFEYRECGETITNAAKIENGGPGYLRLDKVKLSGSLAYSVTKDGCSGKRLVPRASCTVEYRLTVKAELGVKGAFNATATLSSNGGLLTHELTAKPLVKACL